MNYITYVNGLQVQISENGEIEINHDPQFAWRERKMGTVVLADLYRKAGYLDYAERAKTCATWLQYGEFADGSKKLQAVNFCQLRLCPMCTARRARKAVWKLSKVLNMVEKSYGAKFIFLTLTIRNVPGLELGAAIEQLTKSWYRFVDQRQIQRSVKGWFRAVEITRSGRNYHPHLHVILAVESDYFSKESRRNGKYLHQSDLIGRWQKALRVDYRPGVNIKVTREDAGGGKVLASGGGKATLEAAKYAVKDVDYIDPKLPEKLAVDIVKDYTAALHRRRLRAYGGWLKEAARALNAENLDDEQDLVHVDDEIIRDDVADLISTYNWHFGAGEYILASRGANPLKVIRRPA